MKAAKEQVREDYFFSCIYGSGVYSLLDEYIQDPIDKELSQEYSSSLLKNVFTGEVFFVKKMNCSKAVQEDLKKQILNPPPRQTILWPADMVLLDPEYSNNFTLLVAREYSEEGKVPEADNMNTGLLFPCEGYPELTSLSERIRHIRPLNWKNPEVVDLVKALCTAVEEVNRSGYLYCDFHLSRIFLDPQNRVYLNYSHLIYRGQEMEQADAEYYYSVRYGEYPLEFAEPSVVQGSQKVLDYRSQNYSLCALIFYLFFNRYPYDGRLLSGYQDGSLQQHYIKFREYHKMPVFIFDPEDKNNSLGLFDEEQQVIDLWQECPEMIRELFLHTLDENGALRKRDYYLSTPELWLNCLISEGLAAEDR